MKRRRGFIIVLGCVTALIAALLLWPHEREPEYNGATLSTWLLRCALSSNQTESAPAVDAIRHIGTNALPFLVRWIQYEPGWRDSVGRTILKWPVIRSRHDVARLIWNMTQLRANAAVDGFRILGSQANPALPELQRMVENPKAPETALRATQCMILMTQLFPGGDVPRF